jgi:hypothetical protein
VYKYGDLVEIQRLEKRYGELFPESLKKNVARFSSRYSFLGLNLEVETSIDAEKQLASDEREKTSSGSKKKKSSREESAPTQQAPLNSEAVKENEPDNLTKFLRILPPAASYNGPRMATEEIISLIMRTNLPEIRPRTTTAEESDDDSRHNSKRSRMPHLRKRQRNE